MKRIYIIIRKSGLGANVYIKTDLAFLIYGSWDWSDGFGTLKTDLTFLLIWDKDQGIGTWCGFNVPPY